MSKNAMAGAVALVGSAVRTSTRLANREFRGMVFGKIMKAAKWCVRPLSLASAILAIAGCGGGDPMAQALDLEEKCNQARDRVILVLKQAKEGDAESARLSGIECVRVAAEYVEATRAVTEFLYRAQIKEVTLDHKVRGKKSAEHKVAGLGSLQAAIRDLGRQADNGVFSRPSDTGTYSLPDALVRSPGLSGGEIVEFNRKAQNFFSPELIVEFNRANRIMSYRCYLPVNELIGKCEDLATLNRPCEWAAAVLELSEYLSQRLIVKDMKESIDAGWDTARMSRLDANGLSQAIVDICYINQKRIDRFDYEHLIAGILKDCPDDYERLLVAKMGIKDAR